MKKILIILAVVIASAGCSVKKESQTANVSLDGTIEKLGMTTFQYGTHLLKADGKSYALKSDVVDIDSYVGKSVILEGKRVAGYPLENGPELIDVSRLTVK
jgi:hypothetical protein